MRLISSSLIFLRYITPFRRVVVSVFLSSSFSSSFAEVEVEEIEPVLVPREYEGNVFLGTSGYFSSGTRYILRNNIIIIIIIAPGK